MKADVALAGRGGSFDQRRDIRLHIGVLESEAEAAEAYPHVAMRGREGRRGADEGLRQQQAVVEDVVILEAVLDVPVAEPVRDELQRRLAGQAGREHADIVEVARRRAQRSAAGEAAVPVARRAD